MPWKLLLALSLLAASGCARLERNTPLAIARCGLEVGKTCQARLMTLAARSGDAPYAKTCRISEKEFCAWCEASGDPIFYPPGSRTKKSDCDDPIGGAK
jgi:hypothetical protein